MFKNVKLKTKIMGFLGMFSLILIAVGLITAVTVYNKVITTAHEKLKGDLAMGSALVNEKHPGEWSIREGKLFKGETQMNENFTIVDTIGSFTSDTVTIFQGDTRIATNVKDASGNRAVGTKASAAVVDATLMKGQTYIGKANVAGTWNQTAYEPVKDSQGKIVGMFYVGVPNIQYDKAVKDIMMTVGVSGVVGLLIVFVLGIFLSNSITRPINRVVAGLTEGAGQVASSSAQISSSSQQLAEGSSNQAASLEETSSSIEELSSMTKQNTDHVQQAKAMMGEAQRIVENVNTNMLNMAEAISNVSKSTEETSKIIKTIDEIAFQTNLLALNAAVEAARAGEAGAGFAVVANEVRNLAIRAAEAAKTTSNLIENTIKDVEHGTELTKLTQDAFRENMEIAVKIRSLVDEISAASQEQSLGIEQINKAVAEMDTVTQQNAANAEESASASEEMNGQAEQLKNFVWDLTTIIDGNGNGMIAESRSESLSARLRSIVHKDKKALPVPKKGVMAIQPAQGRS
jgi:methyl-accepting chemotaxis protein